MLRRFFDDKLIVFDEVRCLGIVKLGKWML